MRVVTGSADEGRVPAARPRAATPASVKERMIATPLCDTSLRRVYRPPPPSPAKLRPMLNPAPGSQPRAGGNGKAAQELGRRHGPLACALHLEHPHRALAAGDGERRIQ